jgi:hypothetical protein
VAEYTYQIIDLRTQTFLAELPFEAVSFTLLLNGSGKFQGTIVVGPDLRTSGLDLYDLTTPVRRCIYVLRDGVPLWGGLIWTRKYDSATKHLDLNCGDWWSYYGSRKALLNVMLPVTDPLYIATQSGLNFIAQDQNTIARGLVKNADNTLGGSIGLVYDTGSSGVVRDRVYNGYDLGDVSSLLTNLINVSGGPDIRFDIALGAGGSIVRRMLVGTPLLGALGSPNIWEYGGNIQSYVWPSDGSKMATRIYAVGNGTGVSLPVAVADDATRYALGWPLLEGETSYNTVADAVDLQNHANADQTAARSPVVLPQLIVRADIAPILGTYAPGDDAQVIIQDDFLANGINTTMRIVQIDVKPDPVIGEQVILTMAPGSDEVTF